MDYIASAIDTLHILENGPPEELRADLGFDNESIKHCALSVPYSFEKPQPVATTKLEQSNVRTVFLKFWFANSSPKQLCTSFRSAIQVISTT